MNDLSGWGYGTIAFGAVCPTDLPVDHVTHGHSDLHARSLDMVEVEVVDNGQSYGGQRDTSSIATGLIQSIHVIWVKILKVLDHFSQEHWLGHLNHFL